MHGIYKGMPEAEYHARPELSSTEARLLLRPGGPARYKYGKENPPMVKPSKKFDVGSAVHAKVLGKGMPVAVIPDDVLASNGAASTAAAKAFIADARESGMIPMKREELEPIAAQAEGVLALSEARKLLEQAGDTEVTVFGTDPDTGVRMRARFDFLPDLTLAPPVAFDLKTTAGEATPDDFGYHAFKFGYHIQQEFYRHTLNRSGVDGNMPAFRFVVVEKTPPYLAAVIELPDVFVDAGRDEVRKALDLHARCTATDTWPGHPDRVQYASAPNALIFKEDEELE